MVSMKTYTKGVLAGCMIGIGGWVYLSIDNQFIGAFLFSLGLLTIVVKELNLFTGMAATLTPWDFNWNFNKWLLTTFEVLVGNLTGTTLLGFLCVTTQDTVSTVFLDKMQRPLISSFLMSIICGAIMWIAVSMFRKTQNFITVILPVVVFLLIGAEHSIANMFFYTISVKTDFLQSLFFLITTIFGNWIGAVLFKSAEQYAQDLRQ